MDMTIPFLVIGGNILVFGGFFMLLSLTVFKGNREAKEPDIEKELEEVSKDIERM
jgi:hypothetical protein